MITSDQTSTVYVNRRHLLNNLRVLRARARKTSGIFAVVKANAYGHGLREIAGILDKRKEISGFAVHSLAEAAVIRESSDRRILLLTAPASDQVEDCLHLRVEPTVCRIETCRDFLRVSRKSGKSIAVHIKVETGTNRQGVSKKEFVRLLEFLKKSPGVSLQGVHSHFANIEDTTDHSYAMRQIRIFREFTELAGKMGFRRFERHLASSAATLLFPKTHYSFVRPGIALYGLWPSRETMLSFRERWGLNLNLKPVLEWKSRLIEIKAVPAGAYIGYGCGYRTMAHSKLAVVPVGYYDGYDRGLSNRGYVLIRGKRAPIRGRVCMNLIIVDVTNIPGVRAEDEVVLIGQSGSEMISADDQATMLNTINYEVVSRINPLLPREVV